MREVFLFLSAIQRGADIRTRLQFFSMKLRVERPPDLYLLALPWKCAIALWRESKRQQAGK